MYRIRAGLVGILGLLTVAMAVILTLAPAGRAASNALPPGVPSANSAFHWAPYPGAAQPMNTSDWITAGKCIYMQVVDDVHMPSDYVSNHGWWNRKTGSTCPQKATVTMYLEAWACSDVSGCEWVNPIAQQTEDVLPYGGRGKRATAQVKCANHDQEVGFRGYVDVDLDGVQDPPGYTYSDKVNMMCLPAVPPPA